MRRLGFAVMLLLAAPSWAEDRHTLVKWLGSLRSERRAAAVEQLAKEGPAAFAAVARALKHEDVNVRIRAMKLLNGYAHKMENVDSCSKIFLKHLSNDDFLLHSYATWALSNYGPVTANRLFGLIRKNKEPVAKRARHAFYSGGPRAIPFLRGKLKSKSTSTPLAVLDLFAPMGPKLTPLFDAVTPLIAHKNADVRIAALRASNAIQPDDEIAVLLLVRQFEHPDLDVVAEAVELLGRRGPAASKALVPFLVRPASVSRDAALAVMARLGRVATPDVLPMLEHAELSVRLDGLRIVQCTSDADRSLVRKLLKSSDSAERIAATRAIVLSGAPAQVAESAETAISPKVADWDWYHAWWERKRDPVERKLVVPDVMVRTGRFDAALAKAMAAQAGVEDRGASLMAIGVLGQIAGRYVRGTPGDRPARVAQLPEDSRAASARAFDWLASVQLDNGFWKAPIRNCEIGVTALALMAMHAGGHSDQGGLYSKAIRRGIGALIKRQQESGFIGDPRRVQSQVQHLMATTALLDAYLQGSSPWIGEHCVRALRYVLRAQCKDGGWGYQPAGAKGDMYQTAWGAYAAGLGSMVVDFDAERYRARLHEFVISHTTWKYEVIGYDLMGAPCSRSENQDLRTDGTLVFRRKLDVPAAATAAGLWALRISGRIPRMPADDPKKKHSLMFRDLARNLQSKYFEWDDYDSNVDLVYGHFVSLSSHRAGKYRPESVAQQLISRQHQSGKWPAVGAWGRQGGEVYSTAMSALILLAGAQFNYDLVPVPSKFEVVGTWSIARKALRKASRSRGPPPRACGPLGVACTWSGSVGGSRSRSL